METMIFNCLKFVLRHKSLPLVTITFFSWFFLWKVTRKIHLGMKKQNLKFYFDIFIRHKYTRSRVVIFPKFFDSAHLFTVTGWQLFVRIFYSFWDKSFNIYIFFNRHRFIFNDLILCIAFFKTYIFEYSTVK